MINWKTIVLRKFPEETAVSHKRMIKFLRKVWRKTKAYRKNWNILILLQSTHFSFDNFGT
jgi:hypothetical protein